MPVLGRMDGSVNNFNLDASSLFEVSPPAAKPTTSYSGNIAHFIYFDPKLDDCAHTHAQRLIC